MVANVDSSVLMAHYHPLPFLCSSPPRYSLPFLCLRQLIIQILHEVLHHIRLILHISPQLTPGEQQEISANGVGEATDCPFAPR